MPILTLGSTPASAAAIMGGRVSECSGFGPWQHRKRLTPYQGFAECGLRLRKTILTGTSLLMEGLDGPYCGHTVRKHGEVLSLLAICSARTTMVKKLLTIGFVVTLWSSLGIAQSAPHAQSGSAPNARMQAEADEWQRMHDLGLRYKTAWELYMALKTEAGGGRVLSAFSELPDWTGLWERAPRGDVSMVGPGPGGVMPKFTPGALAQLKAHAELTARGAAYQDNISDCGPPGYPSWLDIPFMREFILRPEETWLSSETVNNVRRIYTDGRDHPRKADRNPLYYGDSIGFWDHQKLVIHTNQEMGHSLAGFADELHD